MIEKYIGDAIMAVFGLPRIHEDDALRAVRAAAKMREALAELNVTLRAGFGVTLENRTGVNTGEVVTGESGDAQRLATGDTVNVAARLEQAAPAGEVLIGESTYRLVRDAVEVVPVEPLKLKGKPKPVPAYRLLSVIEGAMSPDQRTCRSSGAPARSPAWTPSSVVRSPGPSVGSSRWSARLGRARASSSRSSWAPSRRGDGTARPLPVLRRRHHLLASGRGVAAGRASYRRTARRTPASNSRHASGSDLRKRPGASSRAWASRRTRTERTSCSGECG